MKLRCIFVLLLSFIAELLFAQKDPNIYGNNPDFKWTFVNSSSHTVIIIFKNDIGFRLNPNGGSRWFTTPWLIDTIGYRSENDRISGYSNVNMGFPSGRKYWLYNYFVPDGGKVKQIWSGGVATFINDVSTVANNVSLGIENAVSKAIDYMKDQISENSTIAVINISSENNDISSFVIDEIMYRLVSARRFVIVDRNTLDTIRTEQNFQLSGDVDDNSIISIGKLLGAGVVITGSLTGSGTAQRLTIKALNVQTAQIITMSREPIN
jgi:TolB-like protein